MKIFALGGFLGVDSDWDHVATGLGEEVAVINPYQVRPPHKEGGIWSWARDFNRSVAGDEKKLLMGYSMGGRLAMHALVDAPEQWHGAILISSHPGLSNPKERILRGDKERLWAQRFRTMEWEPLLDLWERQEVLQGTGTLTRKEGDYNRSLLADTLTSWSLANQTPLLAKIEALDLPILWLAGENDRKFAALAKEVSLRNPLSKAAVLAACGHRLHLDNSPLFCATAGRWIEGVRRRSLCAVSEQSATR